MIHNILGKFKIKKGMELEFCYIKIIEFIKVVGNLIRNKVKDIKYLNIKVHIKGNIKIISLMVMVSLAG